MKKRFLVFALGVFLFAAPPVFADALSDYIDSIDKRCETASDCMIGQIQDCCGSVPSCVNKRANLRPPFDVTAFCQKTGISSVCGFQEIASCLCKQGVCVPVGP